MTVSQLMKIMEQCSPEAEIIYDDGDNSANIDSVKEIRYFTRQKDGTTEITMFLQLSIESE